MVGLVDEDNSSILATRIECLEDSRCVIGAVEIGLDSTGLLVFGARIGALRL
jgi:hypothetical protein